jgi:KDO2-lipid IV(A) lauroyltransferase
MARRSKRTVFGQFFYDLRYRIGEYALRGFIGVLPRIPHRLLVLFTAAMARLTFAVLWKYRARMEANVAMALGGEIPRAADRRALAWRAWKNFAAGFLDTTNVVHWSKEKILARIKIEGEERLQAALSKGKGVIALSAHLGSFTLIGARLAAGGYPFSVVVKHPRDERFARVIDDYRARVGIKTISAKPRREAVRGILKSLRDNGVVLVIADEFKSGGVMVSFMGQRSPAPRGPATLALRTGAVTLPMFAIRQADGSLVLSIGAAIEPVARDDLEKSVSATTELFTTHIEEAVRRYPDQWNWLGFPRNGRIPRSAIGLGDSNTTKEPPLT